MKVLILSDASSIHTIKWVNSLILRDVEIILYSMSLYNEKDYADSPLLTIYARNLSDAKSTYDKGVFKKVMYLKALPQLRGIIKKHNPDILHAHYISSYGTLGALSGMHPLIISVWGSDIYIFPKKNSLFRSIVKYSLKKADLLLSTSKMMALETLNYTDKNIEVTPFGVDTELFSPIKDFIKEDGVFVIGTIKKIDYIYGVDLLIKAFDIILKKNNDIRIKLVIAGSGNELERLKILAETLGISNFVEFPGRISQENVVEYLNLFDVYVALSRSESFGVAVIEAMSCGTPVVVSDVGGLPEVVEDGKYGLLVKSESVVEAADAIQKLIDDESLRDEFSKNGRMKVEQDYDWQKNVDLMYEHYQTLLNLK